MMKAPENYSEWVVLLDMLKERNQDEEVLCMMQAGTLPWQTGVAERFAKKLTETVNFRLNAAADRFQRNMSCSKGQEGAIVQALLGLRKELAFLCRAMNLPVIPEEEREQYIQLVKQQADSIQHSLEDSAKQDRTGKLSSIVRNHKVNTL